MIQTMRDEIQDIQKVVELGTPTPRGGDDRQVRRRVDSGLVGNPIASCGSWISTAAHGKNAPRSCP
eukprot:9337200-Pyramimonas_sp.AAC.1